MNAQKTQHTQTNERFARHWARATIVAATCLLPGIVRALNVAWDGEQNALYTNGVNWVGDAAPRNSDYQDVAIFKENTPANRTPTLSGSRSVLGVRFEDSVGWTLGGSGTLYTKSFYSTGAGANAIAVDVEMKASGVNTVGTGNTLTIKSLRIPNFGISLTGGGTLHLNGQIVGNSAPAAYYININDALARIAATQPAQASSAYVKINHKNARLQLLTTVANAKSQIGDDKRIRDGVGDGLAVKDIGGGYVEVSVAPLATVITIR